MPHLFNGENEDGETKKMKMKKGVREGEREREERKLSRSQTVACAEVQASAFKTLARLAPAKKNLPNG